MKTMEISIYDNDGVFIKTLKGAPSLIQLNVSGDDTFVVGSFNSDESYVDENLQVQSFTDDEKVLIKNAPFGNRYDGRKKQYIKTVDESEIQSHKEAEVRAIRNKLLESSDHMLSVSDYDLPEQEKVELIEYRQYLRDITNDKNFPNSVDFKTPTLFGKFKDNELCLSFIESYEKGKQLKTNSTGPDRLK